MADSTSPTSSPSAVRKPSWLRRLAFLGGGLAALVVVAYFVLTSSAFLKAVVLPRAGKAMKATVTADDIALSPFSSLRLRNLQVQTTGEAPLLRAEEVLVRYKLFSVVRGRIVVPEILLVRPEVTIVKSADGRSNLDPLMAGAEPASPTAPRKSAELVLDLQKVTVRDGALAYIDRRAGGGSQASSITNLNLSLTDLRNDGKGQIKIAADLAQANTVPGQPADVVQAKLEGESQFQLAGDLQPREVKGNWRLNVLQAGGNLREAAGLQAALNLDFTPTEVREVALRFQRQGQSLGEIRVNGPLILGRQEGRLNFQVNAVGRAALNLAGAPMGLDFGNTAITASGFCDLADRGSRIVASLTANAAQFSIRQGELVTPPLDLRCELRGSADLAAQTGAADRILLTAKSGEKELLSIASERALNFYWGRDNAPLSAPGVLNFQLTGLRLADWRGAIGTNVQEGIVNLRGTVRSEDGARKLTVALTNSIEHLTLAFGDAPLRELGMGLSGTVTLTDYRQLALERGTLTYGEGGTTNLHAQVTASYDPRVSGGNVQFTATGELPEVLARHPLPNVKLERGRLRLNTLFNWSKDEYSGTVGVLLGEVAGTVGGYRLNEYSAQFDAAVEMARNKIMLQRVALTAREGTANGGSLDLVGELDGSNQKIQLALNVSGLNQAALRPFVAPALATHDLASVTFNAHGDVTYAAPATVPGGTNVAPLPRLFASLAGGVGEATLRMQSQVTNLVLRDRQTSRATTPVGFGVQLDARRRGDVYELGTNLLQLAATPRARNELRLGGRVDLSPSNALPSEITLRADSLDLTPLYDLVMAAQLTTNQPAAAAPSRATAQPEVEPAPVSLQPRRLTADLKVNSLFLRDLVVSNWIARVGLSNDVIRVEPFSLKLNDAPVVATAALDLTKSGYVYDFSLGGDKVPLDPFVRSFAPQRVGQFGGDVSATGRVAGAGITTASLQKNLGAQIGFSATNLNLALSDVHSKVLRTVVNTVLTLPDILRNPTAALGNLLGGLAPGSQPRSSGWVDDLAKSPIDHLGVQLGVANGRADLLKAVVSSPAFRAEATGTVMLASVLTNSTLRIPVAIWLRAPLAQSIGVSASGSGDTNFARLPDFLTVVGTVGAPKSELNTAALLAVTARAGSGLLKGSGNPTLDKTADTLGVIGNLIGGRPATNAPAAPKSTNAPAARATNAPPANPLDLLLNSLPKKK